jgi:hypothetical protein
MKEVVEIGHPPVGRMVGLCCWLFVELHDFRVRRSRQLVSPQALDRWLDADPSWLLITDRGFVLVTSADASQDELPTIHHFR